MMCEDLSKPAQQCDYPKIKAVIWGNKVALRNFISNVKMNDEKKVAAQIKRGSIKIKNK